MLEYPRNKGNFAMKIIIPGPPVPLKRVRYNKSADIFYNSQIDTVRKQRAIIKAQLPYKYQPIHKQELSMHVDFQMPIPPSYPDKRRAALVNTYHRKRPDLSNLIKWIEDVCIGILFYDDCLISTINAHKVYTHDPKTVLSITDAPTLHYLFEEENTYEQKNDTNKEKNDE